MPVSAEAPDEASSRRMRTRRLAIVFGLIAAGFYVAFILFSVLAGRH